jgi:hypothetical protein
MQNSACWLFGDLLEEAAVFYQDAAGGVGGGYVGYGIGIFG